MISTKDEGFDQITDAIKRLSDLKTTKLSSGILNVLVLTLFMKDVKISSKVTELALDLILKKEDLPSTSK